ncbi:MAG: hypothetical protein U9N63_11255 [Pseudomonadota bacterium]|nr:hypothetical protein [Pseudomonadota bacterium]
MSRSLKNILWTLLFLISLLYPFSTLAQNTANPAGKVSLYCPLNGGRIGDPISFVLLVELTDSAVLEPSSLSRLEMRLVGGNGQNLQKEFFEFEFAPFDHLILAARKSFTIKGIMRFYAPGDYRLAPLSLVCRLSDSTDDRTRDRTEDSPAKLVTGTIESNSIAVRIAGLHPDSEPSPALIIPKKEPRFTSTGLDGWQTRSRLYYITLIFSLLLALFFGVVCYLRRKKAPAPELKGESGRIKELAEALSSTLKQEKVENHWCYLVDFDHLLRSFLLAELKLPGVLVGGCGATFMEHILPTLDPRMAARLQLLWSDIDRIVALEIEECQEFAELCHDLRAWLREYADKKGARYGF